MVKRGCMSCCVGHFSEIISVVLLSCDHQDLASCLHCCGRAFNWVTALALALCNVIYALCAVCCVVVFGPHLDSNVMNNLSAAGLKHLLGKWLSAWPFHGAGGLLCQSTMRRCPKHVQHVQ
jgi:hypothetical protein